MSPKVFILLFSSFHVTSDEICISFIGEHCEEHVAFFKQVFGDQALMRPTTF